jgi:pterin-4a-carbinolamine dehydratase
MGKQMEGDNQRRRTLARQARNRGRRPSEAGVTFGASKQLEHTDTAKRSPLPPAGTNKPGPSKGGPPLPPQSAPRDRTRPLPDPEPSFPAPGVAVIGYRDLVADVGRRAGVDFEQARTAAEATVLVLARALDDAGRELLLDAVPAELHDDLPMTAVARRRDLAGFLDEVARISRQTPEQARYQAQATLSALAGQDRELVDSLDLPPDLRDLLGPSPAGGGLVDATGQTAPLTDEELRAALAELPYWSGSRQSLSRSLVLPPENLDRVLSLLDQLQAETGRGPRIGRQDDSTAIISVRTGSINAVTAGDVDLAHRIDAAIDDAGAGIA